MGFKPKIPAPPKVAPAPTRADAEFNAGQDARKKLNTRQGVFSNIMTTPLGDTNYGQNAANKKLAMLGA